MKLFAEYKEKSIEVHNSHSYFSFYAFRCLTFENFASRRDALYNSYFKEQVAFIIFFIILPFKYFHLN